MERFYQNLSGGPDKPRLPPSIAICKAQRWLSNATADELRLIDGEVADALASLGAGRQTVLPPMLLGCFFARRRVTFKLF